MRVRPIKKTVASLMLPLIVAILSVLLIVLVLFMTKSQPSIQPSSPAQQNTANREATGSNETDDPDVAQTGVSDPSINTTDENAGAAAFPTTKPSLSVAIVGYSINGTILSVTTKILPKASGQCTIELTRNGSTTLRQVSPLRNASDFSQCGNETIDISSAARGGWDLTVRVQAAANVATSTVPVLIK